MHNDVQKIYGVSMYAREYAPINPQENAIFSRMSHFIAFCLLYFSRFHAKVLETE